MPAKKKRAARKVAGKGQSPGVARRSKGTPRRQVKKRARKNPSLFVVGANPGTRRARGKLFGKNVHKVYYEHATEGYRVHEFASGVKLEGLPDGSVRLYHPKKRIWEDM
jgi:hypothetical protein